MKSRYLRRTHMLRVIILTTFIAMVPVVVSAAIIHVPADQPTIQAGIDAANDGDTVLVADGTYTGDGNRDVDFYGKAIPVMSENGAESCVIDCHGSSGANHRGFYFHSNEAENSIVQGFTIKNGYEESIGGGGFIVVILLLSLPTASFLRIMHMMVMDYTVIIPFQKFPTAHLRGTRQKMMVAGFSERTVYLLLPIALLKRMQRITEEEFTWNIPHRI